MNVKIRAWLSLSFAAVLMSSAAAQPLRFALAIVRFDGHVVPFAAYDSGRWERAWPEANVVSDPLPALDDVPSIWRRHGEPVPREWHVWPVSGATPIQAHIDGIEVTDAHCVDQIALKTDLRATKGDHPLKFGVATDSDIPIAAIKEVDRTDVLWRTAERMVIGAFSRLESAKAQADHEELKHESPVPVPTLAVLYRESKSPRSPMYFIAEKQYRTARIPEDPGCAALTQMTGWLIPTEDGKLTLRSSKVFLTDCAVVESRFALPLAALHVSNQLFWVLQEHGYEDETYLVAEIGPNEVRYPVEVNGGGC